MEKVEELTKIVSEICSLQHFDAEIGLHLSDYFRGMVEGEVRVLFERRVVSGG